MVMAPRLEITPVVFGKLLGTALIWNDMGPKELAQVLTDKGYPVTHQTVLAWMRGERKQITLDMVQKLAEATGQPEDYYYGDLSALTPGTGTNVNFEQSREGIDPGAPFIVYSDGPCARDILQHKMWAGSSVVEHRTFNPDKPQKPPTKQDYSPTVQDICSILCDTCRDTELLHR